MYFTSFSVLTLTNKKSLCVCVFSYKRHSEDQDKQPSNEDILSDLHNFNGLPVGPGFSG